MPSSGMVETWRVTLSAEGGMVIRSPGSGNSLVATFAPNEVTQNVAFRSSYDIPTGTATIGVAFDSLTGDFLPYTTVGTRMYSTTDGTLVDVFGIEKGVGMDLFSVRFNNINLGSVGTEETVGSLYGRDVGALANTVTTSTLILGTPSQFSFLHGGISAVEHGNNGDPPTGGGGQVSLPGSLPLAAIALVALVILRRRGYADIHA